MRGARAGTVVVGRRSKGCRLAATSSCSRATFDLGQRNLQMGSSAGAAHVLNDNERVQSGAQIEQKSIVE